ncbi:24458_t:CDS:2, partial [Gigaspora margarita]
SNLNLKKLKLWSTDKQITETIYHSYRLACELTEFLDMIQPEDLSINKENLLTVSSHEDEVSTSYIYEDTNLTNIQEDNNISFAINYASKELKIYKNVDQFLDPDLLSILNNGDSVPNIQNANVLVNFPLSKDDYVFVLYSEIMCIGRVIALYFESYNNYCYTDEPITDLNNVSYISLHGYLPIHLDLFSDILKKGCSLLTHNLASNIFYHIDKSGVLIDENILKLLGDKKNILIILV